MNRHRASEGCLGIAKGCTSNLAGAEGLKLPSPFVLTVRAAIDCVKAYRRHFAGSAWRAGLVRYPRPLDVCRPLNISVRKNRGLPRCLLPGKLLNRSGSKAAPRASASFAPDCGREQ